MYSSKVHIWNKWKDHFSDAFNELKELNEVTAEGYLYGAKNIMQHKDMTWKMTNALDILALAAVSKNKTMENLSVTNKQLTKTIATLSKENENSSKSLRN